MTEVLNAFLTRLSLSNKENILIDMEAGVEHFGRGEKRVDVVVIVVEPPFESIALAAKMSFWGHILGSFWGQAMVIRY